MKSMNLAIATSTFICFIFVNKMYPKVNSLKNTFDGYFEITSTILCNNIPPYNIMNFPIKLFKKKITILIRIS